MPKDCTVHLFSLKPGIYPGAGEIIAQVAKEHTVKILLSGIPHGWIHKPHHQDADRLLSHDWHLFLLTETKAGAAAYTPSWPLPPDAVTAHITAQVALPYDQYDKLKADMARERVKILKRDSDSDTSSDLRSLPGLPDEWTDRSTGFYQIPKRYTAAITSQRTTAEPSSAAPGTLSLDPPMARLLSTALPGTGQGSVSLFNLFKYRSGDPSTHDKYMGDFKRNFGDSAGASVKFMGSLESQFADQDERSSRNTNNNSSSSSSSSNGWQDTNSVQYDSIYHYAHMLSTDTYQTLNQDKVRSLEDTSILLVSEGDAWHEKHFNSETPLGYGTSWSEAEFDDDGYES